MTENYYDGWFFHFDQSDNDCENCGSDCESLNDLGLCSECFEQERKECGEWLENSF